MTSYGVCRLPKVIKTWLILRSCRYNLISLCSLLKWWGGGGVAGGTTRKVEFSSLTTS